MYPPRMTNDRGARLSTWLREEVDIAEPRRIVRDDASGILVSKFAEGFAARLLSAVESLRDIFDPATVALAFADFGSLSPTAQRVDCWAGAVRGLLQDATAAARIIAEQRAEVEAGVDSVAAVLASVLWSGPSFAQEYAPLAGELTAYREAIERMNAENSLFTRYYGVFEGVPVVNHCPGSRVARRLLEQAWTTCTGTAAPD